MFAGAGTPIGGEFQINEIHSPILAAAPKLTGLKDGGFVAVFQAPDSGFIDIDGVRYNAAGVKIGAEFQVNTVRGSNLLDPAIASLGTGGFVVLWDPYTSPDNVKGQVFAPSGVKQKGEFQVNSSKIGGGPYPTPAVAGLGKKGYAVAWHTAKKEGVYTRYFKK